MWWSWRSANVLEDALAEPRERGTAVTRGSGTRVRARWREGAGSWPFRRSSSVMAALVVPTLRCVSVELTRRFIPGFYGGYRGVGFILRGNRISSHDVPTYFKCTPPRVVAGTQRPVTCPCSPAAAYARFRTRSADEFPRRQRWDLTDAPVGVKPLPQ